MNGPAILIIMVFVTVLLLFQGMVVPVFGESAQARKRLKKRLENIERAENEPSYQSLLRAKYLKKLSPIERYFESLGSMNRLAIFIEQSGNSYMAYRVVLLSVILGVLGTVLGWIFTRTLLTTALATVVSASLPYLKIRLDRTKRLAKFEEQLPDAIDLMKRALKAGHPFTGTLKLVAADMEKPVAEEFEMTFNDVSYGSDVRRAMLALLGRVPSVSMMALVTSVLVQRESGGNLAEVLEQISNVIRGRFRFQRKVLTLTAEARMSAWILALIPLILFAAIWSTTPSYLKILVADERGINLVIYGCISAVIGIAWIRRIIQIKV